MKDGIYLHKDSSGCNLVNLVEIINNKAILIKTIKGKWLLKEWDAEYDVYEPVYTYPMLAKNVPDHEHYLLKGIPYFNHKGLSYRVDIGVVLDTTEVD